MLIKIGRIMIFAALYISWHKCAKKEDEMDNKKTIEDETKKLKFVVIYMSMFVLVLFGLGPMI
jgi:hypothetical protein